MKEKNDREITAKSVTHARQKTTDEVACVFLKVLLEKPKAPINTNSGKIVFRIVASKVCEKISMACILMNCVQLDQIMTVFNWVLV
jgi:hypothetical protein